MTKRRSADKPNITVAEIADALSNITAEVAEEIIRERPTQKTRRELRFYPKGGLKVHVAGPKRGKWTNFGDGEGGDLLDLYQYIHGTSKADAVEWAKGRLGISSETTVPELPKRDRAKEKREEEQDLSKRRRTAAFLWRTAGPIAGTPADAYLRGRGITCDLPAAHVGHRHIDTAAMEKMGLLTEHAGPLDTATFRAVYLDGTTATVQQVICDPAFDPPQKAKVTNPKRSNGVMEGSAVRLGEPDDEVILAEGPETGASIHQALGKAVWLVLGTFNFTRVELPEQVTRVVIAVDIEESGAGLAAAVAAAGFWQSRGKRVALMIPDLIEGDFNDVLQEPDGEAAIHAAYTAAIEAERAPHTDAWLIVRSAWDALAAWRSTGLKVKATIKPFSPYRHLDDADLRRAILVGDPGQPVDLGDYTPRDDQTLFEITTSKLSLRELFAIGGGAAVHRLLRMAAPVGRRFFYGLEAAALKPEAPVVVVQSRKALIAARTLLPDTAVVAHRTDGDGASDYHWTPLIDRQVILAPANTLRERAQANAAAARLHAAGAHRVSRLAWPICQPYPGGWRQVRGAIPDGYDFTTARDDGWTPTTAPRLLDMAETIPLPTDSTAPDSDTPSSDVPSSDAPSSDIRAA